MKELKLFICELCGTQYKEKYNAEKCERTHLHVEDINQEKYHANGEYPDRIEIQFMDGKKIWYKR